MGLVGSIKRLIPEQHPLRLSWHKAKSFVAAARYGFPARRLTVIGITGTDGKTTTVGMVVHVLEHCGIKAGSLSTASFTVNGRTEWNSTQKTSPSPFTVQRFLRRLVKMGCSHAVLEYSSHGLVQGRTLWTWPAVAAITNTTAEHLDYHGTMEEYRRAKSLLFSMLQGNGAKVLNRDDGTYELYRPIPSEETYSYGRGPQTHGGEMGYVLENVVCSTQGCSADLLSGSVRLPLHLPVAGDFNLLNAACALCCCEAVGLPTNDIVRALATFQGIPGRIERIDEKQDFAVFVDFTVTPASYTATLGTLRASLPEGKRLLVLMGSCGDRMKEKRPVIAKIASELADVVVVTNEDPYTEDPEKIIDEVWSGIDASKTEAHRISDRGQAIHFILRQAKPGDAVVLCGKGSDTTMWVKTGKVPWNEREIVRHELREMMRATPPKQ